MAKIGKQLIAENINTYLLNINQMLIIKENGEYELQLKMDSLLQSLFLEIANLLDSYNVSICKYPPCNKLVFSTKINLQNVVAIIIIQIIKDLLTATLKN